MWGFIGQSYLKITLEPIRTQNLGSLLIRLSQSNFNLPDSDSVRSYLIATVLENRVIGGPPVFVITRYSVVSIKSNQ